MATAIAKHFDKKVVFVCHTNVLKEQLKQSIIENLGVAKIPKMWSFHLYQSLKRHKIHNVDLMVIDEAHQGGLEKEIGSYKSIIANIRPRKVLGLSATDYNLDKEIFGEKTSANTFTYSYKQALLDQVLNECEVITIHTGLEQTLQDGKKIIGKDLNEVLKKDRQEKVNLCSNESVKAISKGSLIGGIETFLRNEFDISTGKMSQAIFYVDSIEQANAMPRLFFERLGRLYTKAKRVVDRPARKSVIRVVHSQIDNQENEENIQDFKSGKFSVLVNVNQLQEGFDYPDLEVVVDFAPSFSNNSRVFFQRLGRCLRLKKGKGRSRYYLVYRISGSSKKYDGSLVLNESVGKLTAVEQKVQNQIIDTHGHIYSGLANGNGESTDPKSITIPTDVVQKPGSFIVDGVVDDSFVHNFSKNLKKLAPKKSRSITVYTGRSVIQVDTQKEFGRIALSRLLEPSKNQSAEKKAKLIEMARNGEKRPVGITLLGQALGSYTRTSSQCYDPEFTKEIKRLHPDWFVSQSDRAFEKKQKLLKMARKSGGRPSQKEKLGQDLFRYTRTSSQCYDPEFTKEIKRLRPDWFVTPSDIVFEKKQKLLKMARKSGGRPSQKEPLGQDLFRYTRTSSQCYDPKFTKQIRKSRPEWFRKLRKKDRKKA
jgi:superfamily II DNA or RNA helicase